MLKYIPKNNAVTTALFFNIFFTLRIEADYRDYCKYDQA